MNLVSLQIDYSDVKNIYKNISAAYQLENYLNLCESDKVLTSEQRGAIIEYYDKKFFAEYSIMFGDIGFNEVSYRMLKNSLDRQAE